MKPVGIITNVLGFHGLRVIRDKIHLLLVICGVFIFDFSESLTILLLLDSITEFGNIVPIIIILGSRLLPLLGVVGWFDGAG